MRTIGLMTALAMAFGSTLLLGTPAIAEEDQQQPSTEVATEIEKGGQETPPVEAAPPEDEKGQENEKAEEPEQN